MLSTLSAGAVVGEVAAFAPWRPAEAAVSLSVRAAGEVELLALPIEDALGFLPKEVVAQLRTDAARRAVWQKETLDQLVRARQRTRMPPAARAKAAAAAKAVAALAAAQPAVAPTKPTSSVRRPASAGGALSRSYLPLSTSSSAPALRLIDVGQSYLRQPAYLRRRGRRRGAARACADWYQAQRRWRHQGDRRLSRQGRR